METFFEWGKRRVKENKLEKEEREKRYWKLTPIERIDYDNKLERINRIYNLNPASMMLYFFKVILFLMIFFAFLNIFFGSPLLFSSEKIIINNFFIATPAVCLLVLVFFALEHFYERKDIRELNKHFKL